MDEENIYKSHNTLALSFKTTIKNLVPNYHNISLFSNVLLDTQRRISINSDFSNI